MKKTVVKNHKTIYYVSIFKGKLMKYRSIIKVLASVFLLTITIYFTYVMLTPEKIDNPTIQVSRIDLDNTIDTSQIPSIKQKLKSIKGVKDEIIIKNNVIVYFHDNTVTNSRKVFDQFSKLIDCNARMFVVPPDLVSKNVCPVTGDNGFVARITRTVNKIF